MNAWELFWYATGLAIGGVLAVSRRFAVRAR